jgi:hydroxymethylglutaryl-CoA lyase
MTALSEPAPNILICEVGPRDGLQSEARIWSVAERVQLIDRLSASGLRRMEAVSFVNPKRVPQMAGAEEVMAAIKRPGGVQFAGLALNLKGAERAIDAGVDEVRFVVVASESFNQRNQGAGIKKTLADFEAVSNLVVKAGLKLTATIGAAFGCPFEGVVPLQRVAAIAKSLVRSGASEINLADTIGAAVPTQVSERIEAIGAAIGSGVALSCHFHNTRNTGFANAAAAVNAGVRYLDASVGGIGGCPFAPAATGNIGTEDLCFMLRGMGFDTGIDLDRLIETAKWAECMFDAPLPGQVMKAGLFPEMAGA